MLIGGCHLGDCHYVEGNYKMIRRFQMLQRLLRDMGIEDQRVRLEWISASEGERVKTVINSMVEQVRALGPLNLPRRREGWDREMTLHSGPEAAGGPRRSALKRRWPMPDKPKVAFYWCASCGGCEEAVVDLAEDILNVVAAVDIVLWPVAMDFKKKHVEAMPDKSIAATLLNGAIRTSRAGGDGASAPPQEPVSSSPTARAPSAAAFPVWRISFRASRFCSYVYEEAPTVVNEAKTRPQAAVPRTTATQ